MVTMATSSLRGCNSPGESLSCSFIFDILMTITAQDSEKGRGSLNSCCPGGDVGTGTRRPHREENLPADFFPCSDPLLQQLI